MHSLPILLKLKHHPCLLVGGGTVATRRARLLLRADAIIDVVSPEVTATLTTLVAQSGGCIRQRAWQLDDLATDYRLVIAATDNAKINAEIARACRARRLLVNVASDLRWSDVTFPSLIDRAPLTIAVSSGSAAPILARVLVTRINALIPAGYGRLAKLIEKFRPQVSARIPAPATRKRFWARVLDGNVAESIFSGNAEQAETLLLAQLAQSTVATPAGEVYLIGAGPGDPDLLTFRAYRLLQQAEVVLYDRLVASRILEQVAPDTKLIYVGKQRAQHSTPQPQINQQLVDYALRGLRVARLKGGDPFIFGRGGEEIELLAQHQIPFQVVPGITAASGCACYSGIPLTHRDHAQSVRFVTGQLQDGTVNLPWSELVAIGQTLVIYMGLAGLPIIVKNLIAHGLPPTTPAALIAQGTTLDQQVHCSTLQNLPTTIATLTVRPPTLLIIGSVVTLHNQLKWFQLDVNAP